MENLIPLIVSLLIFYIIPFIICIIGFYKYDDEVETYGHFVDRIGMSMVPILNLSMSILIIMLIIDKKFKIQEKWEKFSNKKIKE
jgi:branched-subunit amino acid permease